MIGQQSPILVAETGEHLVESRIQRQSPERKRKKNVFNSLGPGGGGGVSFSAPWTRNSVFCFNQYDLGASPVAQR